jgi:hypothetical protein
MKRRIGIGVAGMGIPAGATSERWCRLASEVPA